MKSFQNSLTAQGAPPLLHLKLVETQLSHKDTEIKFCHIGKQRSNIYCFNRCSPPQRQPALQSMLNPKVQQVQSNNAIADSENENDRSQSTPKLPECFRYNQPPAPSKPQKKSLPTFRNRGKLNPRKRKPKP